MVAAELGGEGKVAAMDLGGREVGWGRVGNDVAGLMGLVVDTNYIVVYDDVLIGGLPEKFG
jgi:hypothetical protein